MANACGVILASGALTMLSLSMTLHLVTGLVVVVTAVVGIAVLRHRNAPA